MENNFDKEIDTLLRQAARSGQVLSTAKSSAHLDADEISIFAENALPEKAKARATKHLAECNDCRTILSNLILLNAEAENETASFAADEKEIAAPIPWYQKLFAFPQIAYGMGALALVFSGVIGFLVYQSAQTGNFEMAKSEPTAMANANASTADADETDSKLGEDSSNMMSANTNAVSNVETIANSDAAQTANANASVSNMPTAKIPADEKEEQTVIAENRPDAVLKPKLAERKDGENEFSVDGASGNDSVTDSAPPPAPMSSEPLNSTTTRSRVESKKKSDKASEEDDRTKLAGNSAARKQIGGKTFNRVNGVWIDSDYRQMANMQQPMTTTVRRGTSEYLKTR